MTVSAHCTAQSSPYMAGGRVHLIPLFLDFDVDSGFARLDQSRDGILERAKIHGINSCDELAFEADLGSAKGSKRRLLDDDTIRQDLDLWAVVLDYRRLEHGFDGVRDVLAAMLYGGTPVILYTDAVSDHIWEIILPAVLQQDKALYEMCHAGSSLMQNRSSVFRDVVGYFLARNDLRMAMISGTQLLLSHFRGHSDLIHLFNIAFQLRSDSGIHNFFRLSSRLPLYPVYKDVMPVLWSSGRKRHAFMLHRALLSQGDHPISFSQVEPFILEIAAKDLDIEPFLHHLKSHGISYSHQARYLYKQEKARLSQASGKSSTIALNPGSTTRPVKLSDSFVARTFATRSISSDFVLSGLSFLGLLEIGPLAVRELALAADNIKDLARHFQQLEDMKVDLGASTYVQVIKNLCFSGNENLLRTVLDSDMHHEAFEDLQMQKRLLRSYYDDPRHPAELDRTLAIINKGEHSRVAENKSGRVVLQTALIAGDWRAAIMRLDDMRRAYQEMPCRSRLAPLRHALRRIWSESDPQTRTDTDYLDRPSYLTGFMQLAQASGLTVHPWQWRSVLYAIGRSQDWPLFRHMVIMIARLFQVHKGPVFDAYQKQQTNPNFTLNDFFDRKMQSLILEVGLTAEAEGQDSRSLWLRGPALLHLLRNRFDLGIDYASTRSAFEYRLHELFAGTEAVAWEHRKGLYLSCLDWAWSEANLSRDQRHPHSPYQNGVTANLSGLLAILQQRSRHVLERRKPVEADKAVGDDRAILDSDDFGRVQAGQAGQLGFEVPGNTPNFQSNKWRQRSEDQDNAPVFYEDLLHPSYKASDGV